MTKNIALWILQILLAAHTVIGAVWKFSNSPVQTMPSLASIPQTVWVLMAILELMIAVCLILPAFKKSLTSLAGIGAALIAAASGFIFYGRYKKA